MKRHFFLNKIYLNTPTVLPTSNFPKEKRTLALGVNTENSSFMTVRLGGATPNVCKYPAQRCQKRLRSHTPTYGYQYYGRDTLEWRLTAAVAWKVRVIIQTQEHHPTLLSHYTCTS